MFEGITARKAGQWAAGILFLGLSAGATGVSLWINVVGGLQINTTTGIVFGLSDVALFATPIAVVTMGWSRSLCIVFAICALASVWNAGNFLFEGQWRRFVTVEEKAEARSDLKERIAGLQRERDAINAAGDVDVLEQRSESLKAAIADEADAGGCGPKCRGLQRERDGVLEQLAAAKRRDELDRRLAGLRDELGGGETVAGKPFGEARVLFTVALTLVLLETLRHVGGYAWHLLRLAARKPRKKPKAEKVEAEKVEAASGDTNVVPLHEQRVTRSLENLTGVKAK